MKPRRPSDVEIHDQIIGAMGLVNPWWELVSLTEIDPGTMEPSEGWSMGVAFGVDGDGGVVEGQLDADNLWEAVCKIADEEVVHVSEECYEQCRKMYAGMAGDVDFDSISSDEVMQVAITGGEPIYG